MIRGGKACIGVGKASHPVGNVPDDEKTVSHGGVIALDNEKTASHGVGNVADNEKKASHPRGNLPDTENMLSPPGDAIQILTFGILFLRNFRKRTVIYWYD